MCGIRGSLITVLRGNIGVRSKVGPDRAVYLRSTSIIILLPGNPIRQTVRYLHEMNRIVYLFLFHRRWSSTNDGQNKSSEFRWKFVSLSTELLTSKFLRGQKINRLFDEILLSRCFSKSHFCRTVHYVGFWIGKMLWYWRTFGKFKEDFTAEERHDGL